MGCLLIRHLWEESNINAKKLGITVLCPFYDRRTSLTNFTPGYPKVISR